MSLTYTLTSGTTWVNGMTADSTNLNNAVNLGSLAITTSVGGVLMGRVAHSSGTVGEIVINTGSLITPPAIGFIVGSSVANASISIGVDDTNNLALGYDATNGASCVWAGNGTANLTGGTPSGNLSLGGGTIVWNNNGTKYLKFSGAGSFGRTAAALATNATDGFFYMPGSLGTPTGVPSGLLTYVGGIAMVIDGVNGKLWCYINSAWKGVALT